MKKTFYLCVALAAMGIQNLHGQNFWKKTKIDERNVIESKKNIGSEYSEVYELDINQLRSAIKAAPQSKTGLAVSSGITLDIPGLDGEFEKYKIYETSNMSPELAEKFPDIKSYRGISLKDSGKTLSFGISQQGVNMILFSHDEKPVVIEPVTKDNAIYLVSPAVPSMLPLELEAFTCNTVENSSTNKVTTFPTDNTDDKKFRTFRLAVSADGEFSANHGGTVAGALAAINNIMSYINPVYERDLSIHMNLIDNNDAIIFLDAANDPYTFIHTIDAGTIFNRQIQQTMTNTIGEANYDLGILFSNQDTGGGNSGALGVVCKNSQGVLPDGTIDVQKGAAYIGDFPDGFPFAMAAAHEMGHQFGANHSFSKPENVTALLMLYGFIPFLPVVLPETGATREPGSGTTIMGYPGVTGTYDVADKHSDQFSHYNISQINNYIKTTSCATVIDLTNNPPVVNAGPDYTIPKGTAFKLTAAATDPDNNNLTYSWEEADISPPNLPFTANVSWPIDQQDLVNQIAAHMKFTFPDRMSTTNPNFRVYPPVSSPTRYFPPFKEVLDGSLYSTWNMISDVTRSMKFVSLVRDNATGGGQTATDEMTVNVNGNAGPFKITSIALNQNYPSGSSHLLKWDVNGTYASPINTSSVNILISTDGGNTFTTLVSNTPNDGQESITIPAAPAQKAYIIVEAVGNIFYAASPAFAIDYNVSLVCTQYPVNGTFAIAPGAPSNININVPVSDPIEDINVLVDLSYTNFESVRLDLKSPTDQQNQLFWYKNCPGISILKATFDQEGPSLAMNCNNLNATPNTRVEPIRLDLGRYYGQNPNGNWLIRAADIVTGSTASGTVNSAAIELCTRNATSSVLSVNDTTISKDEIEVYPNPSNGAFNIMMKKDIKAKIQVFDLAGRLVHSQDSVDSATTINLINFAKGNYLLVIDTGVNKITKKIIIK